MHPGCGPERTRGSSHASHPASVEETAQALLDGVVDGPLHEFWRAKARLERRLEEVRRPTRGTAAGAEALRLAHALAGLFAAPAARPLLRARTSVRKAADAAMSGATTEVLERAYRAHPAALSTLGD